MIDLAPSPSPPATTATVGVPTPTPVRIVDDATTNPWDVAAIISGLLVGLTSLVLAWRAVRIGQQATREAERANEEASKARAAVAAERRRTFELEVLRDLLTMLDTDPLYASDLIAQRGRRADDMIGRMSLLGDSELPRWKAAMTATTLEEFAAIAEVPSEQAIEMYKEADNVSPRPTSSFFLREAFRHTLYDDVLDAIKRRMDARDD